MSDWLHYGVLCGAAGFLAGALPLAVVVIMMHRRTVKKLGVLTDYLEVVNMGGTGVRLRPDEDCFSRLQDELYKTVTALYQTRDAAVRARSNFAENLYNIAHQIKTPVTSMLLSLQMAKEELRDGPLEQIRAQLARLTHMEESLLLLARIDAGTLPLEKRETDVYTLLALAADNLQELCSLNRVSVEIPELGAVKITADLEWTMEAVMNLMKNCMEHTPSGGLVHCSYERNPLYVQIRIWDEGEGFAKEDLPHLFERFYRGRRAKSGGVGIGLAFAKAVIERQNGAVSACNLQTGGACFTIRFYCH